MNIVVELLIEGLFTWIDVIFSRPSEEKINKNIEMMKKWDWFLEIYNDERYRTYIDQNDSVRKVIGRAKLKRAFHNPEKELNIQKRVMKAIIKEL